MNDKELKRVHVIQQTIFISPVPQKRSIPDDVDNNDVNSETDRELANQKDDSAELQQNDALTPSIERDNNLHTELESSHLFTADALPVDYMNEPPDNPEMIEQDSKKQSAIHHLINTLRTIQTDHSTDLVVKQDLTTTDDMKTHTELESSHLSTAGAPPVDHVNEPLDNSEMIERDSKKQPAIQRLVNTLKKIQTIQTDHSTGLAVKQNLTTTDEMETHTELESSHLSTAAALPVDHMNEPLDNPEMIEQDSKKQSAIHHLINTLRTIQTDHSTDLVVQQDVTMTDEMETHIELESSHLSTAAALPVDHMNEPLDNPEVIERDSKKQSAIQRLVNVLKNVQNNHSIDLATTPDVDSQSESKPVLPSESDSIDNANEQLNKDETNEMKATNKMDTFPQDNEIYCKTLQSPFSTFIEIDNFLHAPIFGEISQHTFKFLDPSNTQDVQIDTTFTSTSTYYPEQTRCHLVNSTIHDIVYLTNTSHTNHPKHHQNTISKSTMIPIHSPSKKRESNSAHDSHDFIKIRVPVIVGEYNIEICIEEEILFEEKLIGIKEISKNIVLKNCHFTPTRFSKSLGDGTCAVSNGTLLIEGVIVQNIEYTAIPALANRSDQKTETVQLHEKMVLELIIQLSQEQGIQVNSNTITNLKNGEP